jgi:hypothetical protein
MQGLKEQAGQYYVPMSDQALQGWTQKIIGGQITADSFSAYLKEQAKSLFPGLANAIDQGITVQHYTDPYRQIAAQTLELNPDSVDFSSPKFSPALYQKDAKTGANTSMTLSDFGTYLRGLPDYAKTNQANQQVADFGSSLLNTFGAISQ